MAYNADDQTSDEGYDEVDFAAFVLPVRQPAEQRYKPDYAEPRMGPSDNLKANIGGGQANFPVSAQMAYDKPYLPTTDATSNDGSPTNRGSDSTKLSTEFSQKLQLSAKSGDSGFGSQSSQSRSSGSNSGNSSAQSQPTNTPSQSKPQETQSSKSKTSSSGSILTQSPVSPPHGIVANNLTKEQQQYLLIQLRSRVFTKNEDGDTYLHLSVIYEINDDVIKIIRLADNLEQINEFNKLYQTPLLLAVLVRNPFITRLLVVAGADGTRVDMRGNTPLHIACELKEAETVKMLVEEPRDEERKQYFPQLSYEPAPKHTCRKAIDVTNYRGYYPIHISYFANFQEGIKTLIQNGADIDASDRCSGKTVLHFAVEEQNEPMVKFLVEDCKAFVNAKTFGDRTPLDFAKYINSDRLCSYLESKGGKLFEYHSTSTSDDDEEEEMDDWDDDDQFDDLEVRGLPLSSLGKK